MIPLNIYLQEAFDAAWHAAARPRAKRAQDQLEHAVVEYGNAIKDMVAANIFPGDMLWKNFGVTRDGKVVFYDYDEIEYLTDCNFRKVPQAAQRGRRDERRGLVLGRPEGRVPRDLRALPAGQRDRARGLHEAPRRPARRRLLAEPQGAHPGRAGARRVPYEREKRFRAPCRTRWRRRSWHERCHTRATPGNSPVSSSRWRCLSSLSQLTTAHPCRHHALRGLDSRPVQLFQETFMSESIVIVGAARTPMGGFQGDFSSLVGARPRRRRHQGRRRARRHPGRRRRRSAVRQLPDGRPGPGAGAPGGLQGRPARQRRRRHARPRCAARP